MTLHGATRRDRWLLPYADFVTLLFAVFVMMYAMEMARARDNKQSVPMPTKSAIVVPAQPATPVPAQPATPVPAPTVASVKKEPMGPPVEPANFTPGMTSNLTPGTPPSDPNSLLNDLRKNLSDESREGFLTLSTDLRGVVIALNDRTLFKAGEARIQPSAVASFDRIGNVLARYPNHILLDGHTDSVPIHTNRFRSNWELSTARSMAVMELMEKHTNMPSSRFSIGGSADNSPVSADDTDTGRAQNRRVEIVVLENTPKKQRLSAVEGILGAPPESSKPSPE